MRIDSSAISMESTRKYSSVTTRTARASATRIRDLSSYEYGGLGSLFGNLVSSDGDTEQTKQSETNEENNASLEDISTHFKNLSGTTKIKGSQTQEDAMFTLRQQCVKFLMELLFNFHGKSFDDPWSTLSNDTSTRTPLYRVNTFTNEFYHREEETTTFATTGTVKTADGRELSFNLEFGMSRRFEEYYQETHSTITKYCDPLVINLDTNIAQVSDQKFFFDLDQDGTEEEISTLKSGSGFLALDLNGDGVINDGGELFGTKSGDGFADLAKYDSDGNGWIDEADEIWEKLLIWTKDDEGNDKLYHLSDLGVGAIGLGNVSTQFAINSEQDNHNNAMIRNTGIFLYENGTVSTVQHLDMAT